MTQHEYKDDYRFQGLTFNSFVGSSYVHALSEPLLDLLHVILVGSSGTTQLPES